MSSTPGARHFVIAFRSGRLANRLVLFANFIAFAAEHGHRISNVSFHSYAHLFTSTARDLYCRFPPVARPGALSRWPGLAALIRKSRLFFHVTRASAVLNAKWAPFGSRVVTLFETPGEDVTHLEAPELQMRWQNAPTVFVYGWRFRAPQAVQRHAETIRAFFQPVPELARASRAAVAPLRARADVVVGVHVRRGDYRTWRDGRCYFELPQYAGWLRALAGQFPGQRVAFLVCSDEPRACEEFPGLEVGFGPGFPVGDLFALAECDYVLGPLSTFSQWASFHGNKPLLHLRDKNTRVEREQFRVADLLEVP
ncbi:MAG TPA: hypothetical protein VFV96_07065 [Verrucomicrobiae bacterium]|nr:hypothetical protein [Verrucomicrobiae bacterium]